MYDNEEFEYRDYGLYPKRKMDKLLEKTTLSTADIEKSTAHKDMMRGRSKEQVAANNVVRRKTSQWLGYDDGQEGNPAEWNEKYQRCCAAEINEKVRFLDDAGAEKYGVVVAKDNHILTIRQVKLLDSNGANQYERLARIYYKDTRTSADEIEFLGAEFPSSRELLARFTTATVFRKYKPCSD
jgi:hypothetical protein